MFDLSREEYEKIKDKLMLENNRLQLDKILELKIKGYSITQISMELVMSESTVSRRIKKLKKMIMKVI